MQGKVYNLNLTGKLLVSMPHLLNPKFNDCLIYVCGHDAKGALGLLVNKKTLSINFYELLTELKIDYDVRLTQNNTIYFGGPVDTSRGFVLHTLDKVFEGTVKIKENIGLTSSIDILKAMAKGKGPSKVVIAVGYMNWEAGQLEQEIKNNYWLPCDVNESFLFNNDNIHEKWLETIRKIGIKNEINVSCTAGHA